MNIVLNQDQKEIAELFGETLRGLPIRTRGQENQFTEMTQEELAEQFY